MKTDMQPFVESPDKRVAWLINHRTLHDFEVPLIRSLGLEVYTGKLLPRQAQLVKDFGIISEDYSDDIYSTLPSAVLSCLNKHNFYEDEFTPEVIHCLNTYCETVIVASFPFLIFQLAKYYKGRVLIRVFGREQPYNYSQYFKEFSAGALWDGLAQIRDRLWLASCYEAIPEIEEPLLRERSVILPLGLPVKKTEQRHAWQGNIKKILFVCPRIASHPFYYGKIFNEFKEKMGDMPYVVAGGQPEPVNDPNVMGFASDDVYWSWFRDLAVMFYHSQEPRHLHYHPLEAIAMGMPVVFLRGGLLESFGGADQPGACSGYDEAKEKIRRILNGDVALISAIQNRQAQILESFSWGHNRREWQSIFVGKILATKLTSV